MARQNRNKFEFIQYLYNQFVINERKIGKDARVYWGVLDRYIELELSKKSRTEEKQYALKLRNIIGEATRDFKIHLLMLRGEEGEKQYQQNMAQFIDRLYRLEHDEQSVIKEIIIKLNLNYGNDN